MSTATLPIPQTSAHAPLAETSAESALVKASLYASLGIADYWIVNLEENQVEVYHQTIESASAQFGHDYANRQIYQRGQSVSLLEVPAVSLEVNAMLPG